tara:strand:+ start:326 stop:514 length:189 start_codon:yes stop_codon:yes gene_type:complete
MSHESINDLAKKVEESCEKYAQQRADLLCKLIIGIDTEKYNQAQFETIVKEFRKQVFNYRAV